MKMFSLGKKQKSRMTKVKVCNICGDRGFSNALMYCSECPDIVVHQYCVGIPPGSIDDILSWVCEYCSAQKFGFTSTKSTLKSCAERARAVITEGTTERVDTTDLPESLDVLLSPEEPYSRNEPEVDEATPRSDSFTDNPFVGREEQEVPISSFMEHLDSSTMFSSVAFDDLKEDRSPISSFMEHPKEIVDGLVLLVNEAGVITIDKGMHSCDYGGFHGFATPFLRSSYETDKLVDKSISSRMEADLFRPLEVDETSNIFEGSVECDTNELIEVNESSLETDDKTDTCHPNERLGEEGYSDSNLEAFGKTVDNLAFEISELSESDGTQVEEAELLGNKSVKSSMLRRKRKRPRKLFVSPRNTVVEHEVKIVRSKQVGSSSKKHKRSMQMFESAKDEEVENEARERTVNKVKKRKKVKDEDICVLRENNNEKEQDDDRERSIKQLRINEPQDTQCRNSSYCVTLTGTYIHVGVVFLPMSFVKSSGLFKAVCKMTVIDEEGRSWDVKLSHKKYKDQSYIYHGWKDLQVANNFKAGDVISFKLLKAGAVPVLECRRSSKSMLDLQQKITCRRKLVVDPQVLDAVAEVLSAPCQNPIYRGNCQKFFMYLPVDLLKSSGLYKRFCDMVVVDGKGRPWNMKLNYNKRSYQSYLSHGWAAFQNANELERGDVLSFQLLRDGEMPILKCSTIEDPT